MIAFWTLKALVKLARDAGAPMTIPINGTHNELRIDLADDDTISVARYDYNTVNDEFVKSPRLDFDEKIQTINWWWLIISSLIWMVLSILY